MTDSVLAKQNPSIYSFERSEIKSGDLIAFTHKKINSWYDFKIQMVRAFTRSEYSHVAVAVWLGTRLFAVEAVMPVSRIWPVSLMGDFYHVPLHLNWQDEHTDFALAHVGIPYSQVNAMMAPFTKLDKNNFSECAALATNVLNYAGASFEDTDVPSLLVQSALELGNKLTFVKSGSTE